MPFEPTPPRIDKVRMRDSKIGDRPDRLQWLDSLRGVAILAVVLVHCGQRPLSNVLLADVVAAGQYGVQLFFIVSAITISLTYRQHVLKYGATTRSALAWLLRRVFRIWPLYASAALVYSVEHLILNAQLGRTMDPESSWSDILANLVLIHSWIPSANNSVVPGGWSIGVEVTFYGIFPILMVGRNKRHFPAMLLLLGICLLATSEIVNYRIFDTFAISNNSYLYFWPPTQLPVILIGCAFYFGSFDIDSAVRQMNPWILGALFAALSGVGLMLGSWGMLSPGLAPAIFALAFCCLALIVASGRMGLIANRWMARIGVCSYGIYLVHFAVMDAARVVLKVLALSKVPAGIALLSVIYILVAAVSYCIATGTRRLIEAPGIDIGRQLSRRLLSNSSMKAVSSQKA